MERVGFLSEDRQRIVRLFREMLCFGARFLQTDDGRIGRFLRGNVFASVEGNQLRLQTSVPIGGFLGRPGYYFNGDVAIELNGTQPLDNPQFSRITINGEKVPTDFLNWKYRSRRLREYLADQRNAYDIGTIEIRDGKVILRSRTE